MVARARARTVVSIAGGSVSEFAELANRLRHEEGIAAIEVNIRVQTSKAAAKSLPVTRAPQVR